jgi:hypothetical protein
MCIAKKIQKIQLQNLTPLRNSLQNDYPPQIYSKISAETVFLNKI